MSKTIKETQDNAGATFKAGQYNIGATFKGLQDNEEATFKRDILIKNMTIINGNTELSRKIKKFSKNRELKECTLTNFYEWLKKELKVEK